jgi:diguanylate cyclase (GGDEF)-like protein/PAS domain S-box-containing protein
VSAFTDDRAGVDELWPQQSRGSAAAVAVSPECFLDCVAVRDERGSIIDFAVTAVNAAALSLFAPEAAKPGGWRLSALLPGYQDSAWPTWLRSIVEDGDPRQGVVASFVRVWGRGAPRPKYLKGYATKLGDGVALTWRDNSTEEMFKRVWRRAGDQSQWMFAHSPVGMALVGLGTVRPLTLIRVNDALCTMLGSDRRELVGKPLSQLVAAEDAQALDGALAELRRAGRWSVECRLTRADGAHMWALLSAAVPARGGGRTRPTAVLDAIDITERRRAEARLQRLADLDPLTQLYNRRRFFAELDRALVRAERYPAQGTLLLVDVDSMKDVNDSLGHRAGDQLLMQIAALMRARLRRSDMVGRLGGDEFAVLLPHVDQAHGEAVGHELVEAIAHRGFVISGHPWRASISLGSAHFAPGETPTAEQLVGEADSAMYEAKRHGKNTSRSHRTATPRPVAVDWLERVRDALDHDRFALFGQPIKPLRGDWPDRLELLLRLPDGHGGLSLPGSFLPLAERHNLAGAIDRWVLARAVQMLARDPKLRVNVNLSATSLRDGTLPRYVERLLSSHHVEGAALELELTETAAISELETSVGVWTGLHELGCGLALDDFGAGFTSLAYLRELPFDTIKIDSDYSRSVASNATDRAIVRAIVELARGIEARTTAESVETQAGAEILAELGVDYGQGYHFGRPAPLERYGAGGPGSSLREQPRIGGGDAVDAERAQAVDGAAVVHRPRVQEPGPGDDVLE